MQTFKIVGFFTVIVVAMAICAIILSPYVFFLWLKKKVYGIKDAPASSSRGWAYQ